MARVYLVYIKVYGRLPFVEGSLPCFTDDRFPGLGFGVEERDSCSYTDSEAFIYLFDYGWMLSRKAAQRDHWFRRVVLSSPHLAFGGGLSNGTRWRRALLSITGTSALLLQWLAADPSGTKILLATSSGISPRQLRLREAKQDWSVIRWSLQYLVACSARKNHLNNVMFVHKGALDWRAVVVFRFEELYAFLFS